MCEILNQDGSMARGEQLRAFAQKHGLALTTIEDIRRYRILNETAVRLLASRTVQTEHGEFVAHLFADDAGHKEHVALVKGDVATMPTSYAPLVRIHSECLTGDVLGSRRCDCGAQLAEATALINKEGCGVILYLRQEGRGIGLENKLRAYALQEQGRDTVEANVALGFQPDERDFAVGAHMLLALGASKIRLMTNNPRKIATMERHGVSVIERVPIIAPPDTCSAQYLATKREKLGHMFE
jgi:3,4-dihydroxy 2-butanone 4-phosphate synthase/GTP cyclohydrolase II